MALSPLRPTSLLRLLTIIFLALTANCQSTTLVTATTTITATASGAGACENFYGACVVYGNPGDAPYTTTVWAASPTTIHDATTTVFVPAATTAAPGACNGFTGACVVYGTNGGATKYSTTYYPGGSGNSGSGDGQIGAQGNGDGYIGNAAPRALGQWLVIPGFAVFLTSLAFAVFC